MYVENNTRELSAILNLQEVKGLGPVKFKSIYERLGSFSKIFELSKEEIKNKLNFQDEIVKGIIGQKRELSKFYKAANEQINQAKRLNANIISYFDDVYPPNLYKSNHSVPLLYAIGDLSILKNEKCCAVVGTRKPSEWTQKETVAAVKKLIKENFTIVSGLAIGTDAFAHSTAIENGGTTIAVLGCGVDVTYPLKNLVLKKEIEEKGVVVSEYPFGTRIQEFRLKKRNKITVGISKFVLITQTSEKGGTMNAYRAAVEQKKTVGVFYRNQFTKSDFSGNIKILQEKKISVLKFENGSTVEFRGGIHQSLLF